MRVFTKGGLLARMKGVSSNSQKEALAWLKEVEKAKWRNFMDVRGDFPSAELVEGILVFNVGGNRYRLIVDPVFDGQALFLRNFLTHKEYDKGDWKNK